MAAKSKKEETDIFDLLKDLVKNWHIMLPCIILSGIMGVFAAMWIRPVYQADALVQIENKTNSGMIGAMMGGLGSLFANSSPAETEIELIKSRQIIGGNACGQAHRSAVQWVCAGENIRATG